MAFLSISLWKITWNKNKCRHMKQENDGIQRKKEIVFGFKRADQMPENDKINQNKFCIVKIWISFSCWHLPSSVPVVQQVLRCRRLPFSIPLYGKVNQYSCRKPCGSYYTNFILQNSKNLFKPWWFLTALQKGRWPAFLITNIVGLFCARGGQHLWRSAKPPETPLVCLYCLNSAPGFLPGKLRS